MTTRKNLIATLLSVALFVNIVSPVFAELPASTEEPVIAPPIETEMQETALEESELLTEIESTPESTGTEETIEQLNETESNLAPIATATMEPIPTLDPEPTRSPRPLPPFPVDDVIEIPERPVIEDVIVPQSVLDDINNNPISGGFAATADYTITDISSTNLTTTEEEDTLLQFSQLDKFEQDVATMSTTSAESGIPEEFQLDVVNAPFNAYVNSNESVSLATGALNYDRTLLSLPGRNGLDLNVAIKYNSDEALIGGNEYDGFAGNYSYNGINFAIGWSFNFTRIKHNLSYYYGLNAPYSLVFADGTAYEMVSGSVGADGYQYTLKNYLLDDIRLVKKSDPNEYVLTYSNGTKEYFDGTHGNITKRVDVFGNTITFEYEEIEVYKGSFMDYLYNPGFYTHTITMLTKITDSVGRVVDIDYVQKKDVSGVAISQIIITPPDDNEIHLNMDRVNSYNGRIDVLSSIKDAANFYTYFDYEEQISHIYHVSAGYLDSGTADVNGSMFGISKITYPTGGHTEYEYTKGRRSYIYAVPRSQSVVGWYDAFKVSRRIDSENNTTEYLYEGDYSGYPFGRINKETGNIGTPETYAVDDPSITYKTIVKQNDATTIHTFDYQHKKISEETYANSQSINTYLGSKGTAPHIAHVGNKLYRLGTKNGRIYITEQGINDAEVFFARPTEGGIAAVKSYGSNIIVFAGGDSYHSANIYNTTTDTWSDGGTYTAAVADKTKMFYANGVFYSPLYDSATGKLNHVIYDPSKAVSRRWSHAEVAVTADSSSSFEYIGSNSSYAYYKNGSNMYQYSLSDNTVVQKSFPTTGNAGFVLGDNTYLYDTSGIYRYDFSASAVTDTYSYPVATTRYDVMQKGSDGKLYYFSASSSAKNPMAIYRFDQVYGTWEVVSYRLFDNQSFRVLMGNNMAYITTGKDSGAVKSYNPATEYYYEDSYGFEKVNLNANAETKSRIREEYTYNSYNQMTQSDHIVFNNGDKKDWRNFLTTYVDGRNAVASQKDVQGNVTTYAYNNSPYDIPTTVTVTYNESSGTVTTNNILTADATRISSSETAYTGRTLKTEYTYDATHPGNVTSETLREVKNGVSTHLNTTYYTYDTTNSLVASTTQDIDTTNIFNADAETFANGTQTLTVEYEYDIMGRVKKEKVPDPNLSSPSTTVYRTTQYDYNKNGWLTKTTYPDNTYTSQTYVLAGENNNKITTSHNGEYTTIEYYDGLGRTKKQAELKENGAENVLATYEYSNPAENYHNPVVKVTDASDNYLKYYYDAYGRVIEVAGYSKNNTLMSQQRVAFDDYNLHKTIDSSGKTRRSYYDKHGRLIGEMLDTETGRSYLEYKYDYKNNVTQYYDYAGYCYYYTYDDENRLLTETNPLNQTTSYEYDKYSNVSKVTYPGGNTMSYTYDSAGRLIKTTDVLNQSEHFAYDPLGNLVGTKDKRGYVIKNTYDNMNRMTRTQTGPLFTNYTYDNLGNTLTMEHNFEVTSYEYTYNNLLEKITTPDDKEMNYVYDDAGRLVNVNDYGNNAYVYTYDGANRIDTVKQNGVILADYTYDTSGLITGVTGDKYATTYTYDNAMRVTNKTNTVDGAAYSENYTYDLNGNQTSKQELTDGTETDVTDYTYDYIGRLTGYSAVGNNNGYYTYDAAGNMTNATYHSPYGRSLTVKIGGVEKTLNEIDTYEVDYTYNTANQLLSATETVSGYADTTALDLDITRAYTYDANGNTTAITTTGDVDTSNESFYYDAWNHLTNYSKDSVGTSYGYDGTGMRVSKTRGGVTQKYYWDRGYVVNESTGNTITTSNFIGADGIIARKENNVVNYLVKNAHGDVVKTVNGTTGAIVHAYNYDPYGVELAVTDRELVNLIDTSVEDTNPFRYAGEYFDAESGQIYLRNRYYNPATGRFITEDPIRDGTNWYVYCAGNPVMYVDPWGLDSYVFYAKGVMAGDGIHTFKDEAEIWAEDLKEEYGTKVHIIEVSSAEDFANKWNEMGVNNNIDAVILIFHGSVADGTNGNGEAGGVGYMYVNNKDDRIIAKEDIRKNEDNVEISTLNSKTIKRLIFSSCNTGNPDVYNVAYAFMKTNEIEDWVIAGDGGVYFNYEAGGVLEAGGPRSNQSTWKKYVKREGLFFSPVRERLGLRVLKDVY